MNLKELLKQTTPLPWRLNESYKGYTGHSVIVNASVKSRNGHDIDSVRVLDKSIGSYTPEAIEKYQRDFALLVHAVQRAANDELNHSLGGLSRRICEVLGEANNPEVSK